MFACVSTCVRAHPAPVFVVTGAKAAAKASAGPSVGAAASLASAAADSKTRALKQVLLPALATARKRIETESPETGAVALQLMTELGRALELAETAKPGVCERLVAEICAAMGACVCCLCVCVFVFGGRETQPSLTQFGPACRL